MGKEEIQINREKRIVRRALEFCIQILNFVVATLWIIAVMVTIQSNVLVNSIGVILIITNFLIFAFNVRNIGESANDTKIWKEEIEEEIYDRLSISNHQREQ